MASQQNSRTSSGELVRGLLIKLVDNIYDYVLPEIKQAFTGIGNLVTKFFRSNREVFAPGMFDVYYFVTVIGLVAFGLAVHYSASYQSGEQTVFALAGIVFMIFVSQFRVTAYKMISNFLMMVATFFCIAVLFAPEYHGTHRRIMGFQPSEFAKIAIIMFFAYLIDKYKKSHNKVSTFLVFLFMTLAYGVLILAESHLSGCILFLCIGYAMMWLGDMNKKCFMVITALALFALFIVILKPESFAGLLRDYQIQRIVIWKKIIFNSELTQKERLDEARQVLQSLYGIGSGGLFGKGFGNSGQKVSNLSEKSNDFIFAVLGEELGFFGGAFMLVCFGILVVRGIMIGINSRSYYGCLAAVGISIQMALQVIINVAVATSVFPNTGISLPFFSDGGSSMLFTLASMGIVLGVSKQSEQTKLPETK